MTNSEEQGSGAAGEAASELARLSWLAVVIMAVRGTGSDPTKGPMARAIVLLAVPMILEMMMESVFAVVDIYFVSKLGDAAVAGVAITESIVVLVYTLAIGLSIGVTAMVSRRTGEGDSDGAARAAVQAATLGIGIAAVMGVLGAIYAPELLRVMGADDATLAQGVPYARVILGGNAVILLLFLFNAAFRGAGDAVIAMKVLWLANGLNIVLDPCLIFGLGPFPELGVEGAAIATTIGRGTAVLVQVATLFKGSGALRVRRVHLGINPSVMARLVRLSATGTLQTFIGTASWIALIRIVASFGAEAVAGYQIAVRLLLFVLLPVWGLSNAASTMVGQSLGAGDPERAERAVWFAGKLGFAALGVAGLVFIGFAPELMGLFGATPAATAYAVECLRIVSLGFVLYGYGMVLSAAFNGAGAVWTPTILNFFCFWLLEIPLSAGLALGLDMGPRGVFIAIMASSSALAVSAAILFRRGKWREAEV